jgi:ribosomal protein S18 acetylase RimI-like enzyme
VRKLPGLEYSRYKVNITKASDSNNPYTDLDYLAVHPENQGKGVATALVQSGMRHAEEMGLDIFVLAFKPAWGVYQRLGFRTERELIQDYSVYGGESEYGVRYMIYEPSTRSEVSR